MTAVSRTAAAAAKPAELRCTSCSLTRSSGMTARSLPNPRERPFPVLAPEVWVVEGHEIATYGTAATLADILDNEHAAEMLGQTLDEEEAADKLLTKIATGGRFRSGVNQKAAR